MAAERGGPWKEVRDPGCSGSWRRGQRSLQGPDVTVVGDSSCDSGRDDRIGPSCSGAVS